MTLSGEETHPGAGVSVAPTRHTEDEALALLSRNDLPLETIQQIAKDASLMKSRKVKVALFTNLKTPRHILLPLLRHLFTFDLMQVALAPTIAADIKIAAEESLINRLEKLSLGERLSLARRASSRIAGALLHDPESRIVNVALQNGRLTESAVIKQLMKRDTGDYLFHAVRAHPKWSLSQEIRTALQRKEEEKDEEGIET